MIGDNEQAAKHRATLARYTPELLNHMLSITAGLAVITFLLYTLEPTQPPPPFPKELLLYTIPLVIYGVFRYAMLIEAGAVTGPTDIIISDRPFQGTIVLWALLAGLIVYRGNEIKEFFERPETSAGQVADGTIICDRADSRDRAMIPVIGLPMDPDTQPGNSDFEQL